MAWSRSAPWARGPRSAPPAVSTRPPGWWSWDCRRIGSCSASAAVRCPSRPGWAGRRDPSASPPCWRRHPSSSATSIRKASTRSTPRWPRHSDPKRRRCCSITFRRSAACRWRSRRSARLVDAYPDRIRGIKDSGADLAHTRALLAAVGDRTTVLVGAERHLPDAMPAGARGTICGLANLVPAAVCKLVAGEMDGLGAIEACAAALSRRAGDPDGEGSGGHRAG